MVVKLFNYIGWLIVLAVLQVLVFNNVLLFGYATPFLYVYLLFFVDPTIVSRNWLMLLGFILGLAVDIGSNTLGMHASASVLLAFLRPSLLTFFSRSNDNEIIQPRISILGSGAYFNYLFFGVLIHHSLLISVEFFKVTSLLDLSLRIICSTILTTICIFAVERVRSK